MKRVSLALALAIAVTGALSQRAPAVEEVPQTSSEKLEARLLERLNELRARRGLAPLRASPALSAAARDHSADMAENGYCGHDSADGTTFSRRLLRFYGRAGRRFWAAAENVLCHSRRLSASAVLGAWRSSPGHRANLLSPQWRDVGLAAVYADAVPGEFAGEDVLLVTADFGVRR